MQVICLDEPAYFALIDKVMDYVRLKHEVKEDKWISGEEAMKKLRITSKTTLQKLRDEGKIRFTQPEKKIILYDLDSINGYLGKHVNHPFS